jgi:hypothetical protein
VVTLPFSATVNSASTLFDLTNSGTGAAMSGTGGGTSPGLIGIGGGTAGAGVTGTGGAGGGVGVKGTGTGNGAVGVSGKGGGGGGTGIVGDGGPGGGTGVVGNGGNGGGTGIIGNPGTGGGPSTLAGQFTGNVTVTGNLAKGGGSFLIDHPLDPENKVLYHSFVESPDMMNVYNGVAVCDRWGDAWVQLPEWFEALNSDFRYQLTCIGGFAQVYVGDEVRKNQFRIAGGRMGLKVSWQVTGIRKDPYANVHRIKVEEWKPQAERGTYLHPEAYGKPVTLWNLWVQYPALRDLLVLPAVQEATPPN